MHRKICLLVAIVLLEAGVVLAVPILSVDLDPLAAGIQDTLSVGVGSSFGVDVVVTGDGTLFDNATLDTPFNDSGPVLALASGPTAGSLAGAQPSIDGLLIFSPVAPGDPLSQSTAAPPAGFSDGLGGAGMQALGLYPGVGTFSILSLSFAAVDVGSSTIGITGIFGTSPLAGFGLPIDVLLESATVTVVPEPSALGLLAVGWLGILWSRRARRMPP